MSDNEQSVFTRYAGKPQTRLEVIDGGRQPGVKSTYKAYGIDKPNNRRSRILIECNTVDKLKVSLPKSYLSEVQYSAERFICLMFTSSVFLIEGEHLDEFFEYLDEEQIRSIHGFNPHLHEVPAEGEAIITRIRRMGLQEAAALVDDEAEAEAEA